MKKPESIRLNIQVKKELRDELKFQALFRDITLREYITNILVEAATKEKNSQAN